MRSNWFLKELCSAVKVSCMGWACSSPWMIAYPLSSFLPPPPWFEVVSQDRGDLLHQFVKSLFCQQTEMLLPQQHHSIDDG